ncbi:MAG: FmdB family zinc ribbon protein [Betaproteobacteria bacterium]
MPIYEYRCASCGHEVEALQKLRDAPLTECPACHRPDLKKLLSAAGFQLKGSGWYVTDFRNRGAKPATKEKPASDSKAGDAGTKPNSSADAASGADSKPAAATSGEASESKPAATPPPAAKNDS